MPIRDGYAPLIEAALVYEGGGFTVDDVAQAEANGEATIWYGPRSVVVTQIDEQPRRKILHFFLAAGHSTELEAMTPGILQWGEEQGCTTARLVGRKGWTRSFLARTGWQDTELVIMEKAINVSQ